MAGFVTQANGNAEFENLSPSGGLPVLGLNWHRELRVFIPGSAGIVFRV